MEDGSGRWAGFGFGILGVFCLFIVRIRDIYGNFLVVWESSSGVLG